MKKIWSYLRAFFSRPGILKELISAAILTAALLVFNEQAGGERQWLKADPSPGSRLLKYLALYAAAFAGAYFFQVLLFPKDKRLRSPRLWGGVLLAIFLFSVRAWYYQYGAWVSTHFAPDYQTVAAKYCINAAGLALLALPVVLFWVWQDRKVQPLYGFTTHGVNLKPYFGLLLLMLPLLLWAAQQPDFQETYPRYEKLSLPANGPYNVLLKAGYEFLYSQDFITTEFFFRGFLILHFVRLVGARAVLPMCVFYVTIHFDKPLAEAISSFFGGLVLGILALETRSIWGGIIVHLGIALLMETLGILF